MNVSALLPSLVVVGLVASPTTTPAEPAPSSGTSPAIEAGAPFDAAPTCLVVAPEGTTPEGGWPVFVLLHGYGTNKEDFDELAAVVSGVGAVAIAIDAPEEIGRGRRSWGPDIDETHTYIQTQLAGLRSDPRLDFGPIHVGGFSQGGIRSLLLAAHYPNEYGGVLSVSPAGGGWPDAPPPSAHTHPMRLVYGTAENDRIVQSAQEAVRFWKEWGQSWEVFTHPGGHQFPGDWRTVLGEGAAWILDETRAGARNR